MANNETLDDKLEEPSAKAIDVSADSSGVTITETEQQTQTEHNQQLQPSMAARAIGLSSYNKSVRDVAGWTLTALIFGFLCVGLGAGAWPKMVSALLWSAACIMVGWVLGFLFGIPRTLQTDGQSEVRQTAHGVAARQTTV